MTPIRPSTPADGDRAVEIWRRAVQATHGFLDPADLAAIDAEVSAHLPQTPLWLAVDAQDRPLAIMGLTGAHLDALFVDPEHHGEGVGRALVEHALSLHPVLSVDVNEQNLDAQRFYERLGFERVGRRSADDQGRPYPLIEMRLAGARPRQAS